jgi:hypothetical protein
MPHPLRDRRRQAHAEDMTGTESERTYAVSLDELESTVRVPVEDQTTEQPSEPPDVTDGDWLDQRRQARLAGGA